MYTIATIRKRIRTTIHRMGIPSMTDLFQGLNGKAFDRRRANEHTATTHLPMIIRQLAHLCFFTHQLDVMVAFYRDKLGFPIAFTMRNDDGFQFGYYFDLGNTTFIEI